MEETQAQRLKWLAALKRENARRLMFRRCGASAELQAELAEIRDRGRAEHLEELREVQRRLQRLIPLEDSEMVRIRRRAH